MGLFSEVTRCFKSRIGKIEQKEIELQAIKQNFIANAFFFIKKNIDENTQLETPEKILLTKNNNRSELKLLMHRNNF